MFGSKCPPISVDEVVDRPFAWCGRRAGSDLLPADDEERLHLRERKHQDA